MSNTKKINKKEERGSELFCEAATTLLEDIDKVAAEISPEEAKEFEEIFHRISNINEKDTFKYNPRNNDCNLMAAEDNGK